MKRFLITSIFLLSAGIMPSFAQSGSYTDDIYYNSDDAKKEAEKAEEARRRRQEYLQQQKEQEQSAAETYSSSGNSYNDGDYRDYSDDFQTDDEYNDDYPYARRLHYFGATPVIYPYTYWGWGPSWGWNYPFYSYSPWATPYYGSGFGVSFGWGGPYWSSSWAWSSWYGYPGFYSCWNYPCYGWGGGYYGGYWNGYYDGLYNNGGGYTRNVVYGPRTGRSQFGSSTPVRSGRNTLATNPTGPRSQLRRGPDNSPVRSSTGNGAILRESPSGNVIRQSHAPESYSSSGSTQRSASPSSSAPVRTERRRSGFSRAIESIGNSGFSGGRNYQRSESPSRPSYQRSESRPSYSAPSRSSGSSYGGGRSSFGGSSRGSGATRSYGGGRR